jgi:thiamine-phosphate pyrophosphorylase
MSRRQPLPRLWLMTDERLGDELWDALERLPRHAGIVFRHYHLAPADRRALFLRVRLVARRRTLRLVVAGDQPLAADGRHGGRGLGLRTASAHSLRELKAAERAGADLVFLSPVFATRSHPGAQALGPLRFGLIARHARVPLVALGGMDARRGRALAALNAYGWAGIDAWTEPRKG